MNTLMRVVGVNLDFFKLEPTPYFRNQLTLLSLVGVNLEFFKLEPTQHFRDQRKWFSLYFFPPWN